jgi:hypothetical protein
MPQENKRSARKHLEKLAALKSRMLRLMEDLERAVNGMPQATQRREHNMRLVSRRNGKKNGNGHGNGKKNGNGEKKNELKKGQRHRRGRR